MYHDADVASTRERKNLVFSMLYYCFRSERCAPRDALYRINFYYLAASDDRKMNIFNSISTIIVMRNNIPSWEYFFTCSFVSLFLFNFPWHFPSLLGKFNFDCALRKEKCEGAERNMRKRSGNVDDE
jgi:hypothetical protein